jgi:transposase
MANQRLAMRRIREILRLCWDLKLGQTKVAQSLGISSSTVNRLLHSAVAAGLTWPLPEELDDPTLERLIYPPPEFRPKTRPEPDWQYVYEQLKSKGVTLTLLWQEYKEHHPDGYQLSQFCDRYRSWRAQLNIAMRQKHRAGDKTFSDFAGAKFTVIDPSTGEVQYAHLFVSALGASNFTFADVFRDESSESWCTGQALAFQYFGGVPAAIVPDNPRSAVNKPCRYEPELNEAFRSMASHFGCAVLPARVRHPKDKAKAESAVGVVTRWIFARLRNRTFFSFEELRAAIRELLDDLNNRPFKKLPGCRRSAFEHLDRPALKPLPSRAYEYFEINKVRVGIDHHVEFEQHWYSVPFHLVRKEVELRVTATCIEILHGGRRVCSHHRSFEKGTATTEDEHRPKAHREYATRSPARLLTWAQTIGSFTLRLIESTFESKLHPEQAYNRSIGILKLAKKFGNDRLDAACNRGLLTGATSYSSIKSILTTGLDRLPVAPPNAASQLRISHQNIRGANYFITQGENVHANTTHN